MVQIEFDTNVLSENLLLYFCFALSFINLKDKVLFMQSDGGLTPVAKYVISNSKSLIYFITACLISSRPHLSSLVVMSCKAID